MDTFQTFYLNHQNIYDFALFLVGTFFLAHVISYLFHHVLNKLAQKTSTELDDKFVVLVQPAIYWGIVFGGIYFSLSQLEFLQPYMNTIKTVVQMIFIFILLRMALRFVSLSFEWVTHTGKLKKKQQGFLLTIRKILNAIIYFLAVIFVLQAAGIPISPLIASLGIGGLAVGLALQPTLSNYFSGLYVAADGFIQPNDYIELDNGLRGYVVSVGWRNTVIRMWNNNLVMIPNSKIADSMITNYNEPQNKSSFIVYTAVAYHTDLQRAEDIVLEIANKTQKNEEYGVSDYEPVVRYHNFGDSNIDLKVIMQSNKYVNHYLMKHEFMKALKSRFDKEGIVIAHPVRSIEFMNKLSIDK